MWSDGKAAKEEKMPREFVWLLVPFGKLIEPGTLLNQIYRTLEQFRSSADLRSAVIHSSAEDDDNSATTVMRRTDKEPNTGDIYIARPLLAKSLATSCSPNPASLTFV